MLNMAYAVHNRVTQIHVRGLHVDFGTQHRLTIAIFTGTHLLKLSQVLFHTALTIRTVFARTIEVAFVLVGLLRGQITNVRFAILNQSNSVVVERIKIIGGVTDVARPLEAEPLHILFDGIDKLLAFLFRVGVIKAQVTLTLELLR